MKRSIIQVIPNIGLVGGTAAKVKILAEYSNFQHIVCYTYSPNNKMYAAEWLKIRNCILAEVLTVRNPFINAYRLYQVVRKYKAQIIHVYFPIGSVSAGLLKLFCPSLKIMRSFEGILPQKKGKNEIQNFFLKKHNLFIAISEYVKQYYEKCFPDIRNKIQVVYNCPAFFQQPANPIFHDVNKKILVSIGGLNPTKNTETLVEAVKLLKDRNVDVKAYVLGDGPLREQTEEKIKSYGLQDYVFLCGYCNNVIPYLDESSIYVHTANLEGFGMAVIEAMSRYCAVIVSDSCALPELVDDGVDGLIAATYDANGWANKIEYLLSSQALVNEFGEKAHHKVSTKFSINAYVSTLDSIYSKLYENN